jgi:hypothetical protein
MSIPASDVVQINPAVISAGGSALALNGVVLTQNSRVPIGVVSSFAKAADVGTFFGLTSTEYQWALTYFAGRNNATIIPGAMLFAQYPEAAVPAWLRGGSLAAMTLAQLQAVTASLLTIVSDGVREVSASINLSGASSFSNAAALITAGFTTPTFAVTWDTVASAFVVTNTTTGITSTLAQAESTTATASACTTTGAVLTVGGSVVGTFHAGDTVTGTDGTHTLNAKIIAQLTGATPGGAGTYSITAAATPADMTSAAVTAEGPLGAFAVALKLTTATGATLSQGAAAAAPATYMSTVTAQTLNWGVFSAMWNTSDAEVLGFAQWTSQQSNRFAYVAWDTNAAALVAPDTTTSIAAVVTANYGGIIPVYCDALLDATGLAAAMVLGIAASIDFNRAGGRITMDFKYTNGVPVSVLSQTSASNLRTNKYNFVGTWATANDSFTFLNPGSITGTYLFADEFLNQVYLNSQLQLALMTLLTSMGSIPYSDSGNSLISAACQDPINEALTFGSIVPGVTLSAAQIAQVNTAAGLQIDRVLSTRGWYLKVGTATAQVRAARGTPPVTLWYMDGGSVQQINVASILVQ